MQYLQSFLSNLTAKHLNLHLYNSILAKGFGFGFFCLVWGFGGGFLFICLGFFSLEINSLQIKPHKLSSVYSVMLYFQEFL